MAWSAHQRLMYSGSTRHQYGTPWGTAVLSKEGQDMGYTPGRTGLRCRILVVSKCQDVRAPGGRGCVSYMSVYSTSHHTTVGQLINPGGISNEEECIPVRRVYVNDMMVCRYTCTLNFLPSRTNNSNLQVSY